MWLLGWFGDYIWWICVFSRLSSCNRSSWDDFRGLLLITLFWFAWVVLGFSEFLILWGLV